MPRSNRLLRRRAPIDRDDVWTPGDVIQMDAVVAGCAMVAQADGWVTLNERTRMIDRMRNSTAIAFFGADDARARPCRQPGSASSRRGFPRWGRQRPRP